MSTHCFALLIVLIVTVSRCFANHHAITFKSCDRAKAEGRIYMRFTPDDFSDAEIRVALVILRAWDDITGPYYPVFRDFWRRPRPGDVCNAQRTYRCIDEVLINSTTVDNVDFRVSRIRDCFNDQYGEADSPNVEYLRPYGLQLPHIVRDCVDMLQLPKGQSLVQSGSPDWQCLLRCAAIRSGVYTDVDGPQIVRLELLYGAGTIAMDNFVARAEKCTAKVRQSCTTGGACEVAARYLDECFYDFVLEVTKATNDLLSSSQCSY